MNRKNCFHGTKIKSADQYLKTQSVCLSVGDRHWLGDGFYLFDDSFFAFKWIAQQCFSEGALFDKTYLNKSYKVLQMQVQINENRTFDLRKVEYFHLFRTVLRRISEKKVPGISFSPGGLPDGVVINYLFKKTDYGKRFDLVIGSFSLNELNSMDSVTEKQRYIIQTQYCVKNTAVLSDIQEYDYSGEIASYIEIWEELFPTALPIGRSTKEYYGKTGGSYYEYH